MLASLKKWWSQPFNSQGSVVNWALFIGLLLVILIAWSMVLRKFEEYA